MSSEEIIEEIYSTFKSLLTGKTRKIKDLNKWLETEEGKTTFSNLLVFLRKLMKESEHELSTSDIEKIFEWEVIRNDY